MENVNIKQRSEYDNKLLPEQDRPHYTNIQESRGEIKKES